MSKTLEKNMPTDRKPVAVSMPRVLAVDALRGFDMFWIIQGKEVIVSLLILVLGNIPPWLQYQFSHPDWEGFSAWDIIMPLFLFITGVTIPFSMEKYIAGQGSKRRFYMRLFRRFVLLWLLGMVAQGNLLTFDINKLHLFSNTLQAIAVGYLVSSFVLLYVPLRFHILVTASLLLVYWIWMMFIPLPGVGTGILQPEQNWAMYIDELILGRFRDGTHYTWILSSLGFSATVMLGTHAGYILRKLQSRWKIFWAYVAIGIVCLLLSWLWSWHFPIIKHIWSSSMVLWSGGWCFLLLAIFYLIMEIGGITKWAFPFIIIGSNAIIAYIGAPFIKEGILWLIEDKTSPFVIKHIVPPTVLVITWLILYLLYRKKWFLRV
ncbi:MAG TPA: DUF5009 domain-containing protein [Candidatus Hydrogenedens sp.]|nr:DUF5009 domain-containing protein [Candidatus Hydrogenedens sp.]